MEHETALSVVQFMPADWEGRKFQAVLIMSPQSKDDLDVISRYCSRVYSNQIGSSNVHRNSTTVAEQETNVAGSGGLNFYGRDENRYGIKQNISKIVYRHHEVLFAKVGLGKMTTVDGFGGRLFSAARQATTFAARCPLRLAPVPISSQNNRFTDQSAKKEIRPKTNTWHQITNSICLKVTNLYWRPPGFADQL